MSKCQVCGTDESQIIQDADISDSIERSKEFRNVSDFHKKFGLLNFDKPGLLTRRKLKERVEFLLEELTEFAHAAGLEFTREHDEGIGGLDTSVFDDSCSQDLAEQADALVDIVYVALGTAVMLGLPWDWLWDDVQRANMEKVRGVTKRGHAVDVTKPPGWLGPQGTRILNIAGYDPKNSGERDDK